MGESEIKSDNFPTAIKELQEFISASQDQDYLRDVLLKSKMTSMATVFLLLLDDYVNINEKDFSDLENFMEPFFDEFQNFFDNDERFINLKNWHIVAGEDDV